MNLALRCAYMVSLLCIDQSAPITRGNRSHILSTMKVAGAPGSLVQVVGAGHNAYLARQSLRGELLGLA